MCITIPKQQKKTIGVRGKLKKDAKPKIVESVKPIQTAATQLDEEENAWENWAATHPECAL